MSLEKRIISPETTINIRWLLRMIAKKGIGLFLRLLQASGLGHISHQLREIFIDKWSKSGAMRLALA